MPKSTIKPSLPEIIAVGEDHSVERCKGIVTSSDILSVYLEGGPRYSLDHHTYKFTRQ